MSEYAPRRKRALLSTLMFCGFSLGSAASGFVASHIIPAFGWRSLLVVGGALPVVLVFLLAVVLPESVRFLVCQNAPAERIAKTLRRIAKDVDFTNASLAALRARDPSALTEPRVSLFRSSS